MEQSLNTTIANEFYRCKLNFEKFTNSSPIVDEKSTKA